MNKLLNYLPPYEQESKVFQEIMNVMEDEFDELFLNIEVLDKQLNPDTATWGLAILEKELGLPVNPDLDTDTRRSLIKSKLLMQPPGSKNKLEEILKSFVETAETEEIFNEYRFNIILKTLDTIGHKIPHIYRVVEEFKPAHLDYIFIICYLYYPKVFIEFQKYFSEKFKVTGTEDVSGNEYISTLGKSYKERVGYKFDSWISLNIPTISQKATIDNLGSTYKSKLSYNLQPYVSGLIPVCSKNTYTKEGII